MSLPAAFGYIIDIATGSKAGITLNELALGLTTVFCLGGIGNGVRMYCFSYTGHSIVKNIRTQLFDNIVEQEVEFFDKNNTGEFLNRLSSDTTIMGESFGGLQLSALLRNTFQMIGSFTFMMYLSPDLTVVMTALIPIGVGGSIMYGKFVKTTQQRVQESLSDATAYSEEKLSNIRTIRAFTKENREKLGYLGKINNVFNLSLLQTKGSAIFFGSTGLIGNLFMLTVLVYGANLVSQGVITSGLLTSCLLYSLYVGMAVINLTSSFSGIMRGIGASTRVFEIIDKKSLIPNNIGIIPEFNSTDMIIGEIAFNNVKFTYPTRPDVSVLNGFTLSVEPNKSTALVGKSGSGKSTVISLLLRYYDAHFGDILINGYNIKDLNPNWLRDQIGVVPQEPILFNASIKDNILYGLTKEQKHEFDALNDNNETMNKLLYSVCKDANALDFITNKMQFPDGFDTMIGENAISGGQKQRISIARSLIRKPKILYVIYLYHIYYYNVHIQIDYLMKQHQH